MKLTLTLHTADKCVGRAEIPPIGDYEVAWDAGNEPEPQQHTTAAFFELFDDAGMPCATQRLSGDEWRELEMHGLAVMDIALMCDNGISLEDAVRAAQEGDWPMNFDADAIRENLELRERIAELEGHLAALIGKVRELGEAAAAMNKAAGFV